MTQYSIKKLCTIRNLRMQKGEWLIDFTDYLNGKSKTKTLKIGKRLNWRKLSEKTPKAVFNKHIKDRLAKEMGGITFVKLKIEVVDNKGYWIPFHDEYGNLLINADTGNSVVDDLTEAIRRHNKNKT